MGCPSLDGRWNWQITTSRICPHDLDRHGDSLVALPCSLWTAKKAALSSGDSRSLYLDHRYKASCSVPTITFFTIHNKAALNMQHERRTTCGWYAGHGLHVIGSLTLCVIWSIAILCMCVNECVCVCMLRLPVQQTDGIIMTSLHTRVMFSTAQSRRKKLGDECLSINLKETQKNEKPRELSKTFHFSSPN